MIIQRITFTIIDPTVELTRQGIKDALLIGGRLLDDQEDVLKLLAEAEIRIVEELVREDRPPAGFRQLGLDEIVVDGDLYFDAKGKIWIPSNGSNLPARSYSAACRSITNGGRKL